MLNALCCPFLKFTSLAPLVAIFVIFGLYFMLQSPEEIDVLPMVEPQNFAVSANFRFKPLFNNSTFKGITVTKKSLALGQNPKTRQI